MKKTMMVMKNRNRKSKLERKKREKTSMELFEQYAAALKRS
jgi:hypothetical protein